MMMRTSFCGVAVRQSGIGIIISIIVGIGDDDSGSLLLLTTSRW
jgi:hypothetical protein